MLAKHSPDGLGNIHAVELISNHRVIEPRTVTGLPYVAAQHAELCRTSAVSNNIALALGRPLGLAEASLYMSTRTYHVM